MHEKTDVQLFLFIVLHSKESSTGSWLREKNGNFSESSSLYSSAVLKLQGIANPLNTLSFNFLIYMILNPAFFVANVNENKGRGIETNRGMVQIRDPVFRVSGPSHL